ncbi:transcription factor 20 isoform X2 [Hemibagrus wyckioides]|nr:transcription factor 20 isoform X1 [Hemibagrus wyckioides]XP_058234378.1 transcription factor 20 isoform X1 [Hemibagrus wyckioides]XP_058234379.1 transcription factor 20 isoform X2 [Hemibagrus wyckioides]
MDPLRGLNSVQLQDPLSKPLDLTKQISEALDLVKKKPSRSGRFLGSRGLRSPRSEFSYESASVPLNSTLRNGLAHDPVTTFMSATENIQTDGVTGKVTKCRRAGEKRERNAAGFQDAPSSHSSFQIPFPNVETLSSECSRHGRVECISSDDSVIEVPVSNGALLMHRVTENLKQEKERMEDSSPIMTESDVLQDSDSLESRNVLSTSEAENADFKPTQNGSGSSSPSSSLSQKRAPETKKNRNQQRASAGKKATASVAKRRKKKKRSGISSSPSAFPSHGPEIKLKFASCKEEKREGRGSAFAPYVRVEFSACTVVNFEEEGNVQVKTQRQVAASPGVVPTTSCLQLGRLGSESRRQTGELCCLCGCTANIAGLGDLHGPYHPKEASTDLLTNGHEDSGAKRTRLSDERWVHEDCSIWSAGVFLVKGRLYGLDEAVRLAQETVCSCCLTRGATLGCFFKGCPNKYHFPCALQAGCVFNEENFTLRCPKHKNKPGLAVSRLQNR